QKLGDFNNAVSALDAAYVLEAVSGLRQLEPSAVLACDVTGDGTLSAVDAARILQYEGGVLDRFPVAPACESDWVFVAGPLGVPLQRLVPRQSSATRCQRGGIAFQPLQSDVAQQNFVAALYGDCTGNWSEAVSGASLRLRSGEAQVRLGVTSARPGGRWVM